MGEVIKIMVRMMMTVKMKMIKTSDEDDDYIRSIKNVIRMRMVMTVERKFA